MRSFRTLGPCSLLSASPFTPRGGASLCGGPRRGLQLCLGKGWGGLVLHLCPSVPPAGPFCVPVVAGGTGLLTLRHRFLLLTIVGVMQVGFPCGVSLILGQPCLVRSPPRWPLGRASVSSAAFKDGSWYKKEKVTEQASGCRPVEASISSFPLGTEGGQPGPVAAASGGLRCRDCFKAFYVHKFRAVLGKNRLIFPGEKVEWG